MRTRVPARISYDYVNRLFAALDDLGIDPAGLPPTFLHAAWEDKAYHLKEQYGVSFCPRCKLPKRSEDMDFKYAMCERCGSTLHKRKNVDPRIHALLRAERLRVLTGPADPITLPGDKLPAGFQPAPIVDVSKIEPPPSVATHTVDEIMNMLSRGRKDPNGG